jgi:hypothetical protein
MFLTSGISFVLFSTGFCLFCSILAINYCYFTITEIMYIHNKTILNILWHVDPLLGNDSVNKPAANTQPTIQQTHFQATPTIHARNNRTGVGRGVYYVVRIYTLLGNGCVLCAVVRPESIQREANDNWQSNRSSVQFSCPWREEFYMSCGCSETDINSLQNTTSEDWEDLACPSDLWRG